MSRRRFIAGVILAATPLGATASAQEYKAQQAKKAPRIGILSPPVTDRLGPPPCHVGSCRRLDDVLDTVRRVWRTPDLTIHAHKFSEWA